MSEDTTHSTESSDAPKKNWVAKIVGLIILWMFMPATAFFKMQDTVNEALKKDEPKQKEDAESDPK